MVTAMEAKLRNSINTARDILLARAVALETSRKVFIEETVNRINSIRIENDVEPNGKPRIKLVSIDVPQAQVHQILKTQATESTTLSEHLSTCIGGPRHEDFWDIDHYSGELFVSKTHVTMLFWQETTEDEMREKFGALLGASVEVHATALLWDDSVLALEVKIAETTLDGRKVPASKNNFVHVTVWVAHGAKAWMSNLLPEKVRIGNAHRVELISPVRLIGLVSFWDFENNPILSED